MMKLTKLKSFFKNIRPLLFVLFLLLSFFSCRSSRQSLMTESLYMQYKRINIEYPFSQETAPVLAEEVTFTPVEDITFKENLEEARLDTNRVYELDEVRVEVRSTFASERNGHVNVEFLIRVPQELLSSNWRMTLTPELIDRDSVILLGDVVLNGSDFQAFQQKGYEAYQAYESSIIPPDNYDETFMDYAGIAKDIRRRQVYFLDLYRTEWDRRKSYAKWKDQMDDRNRYFNLRREGKRAELYHKYLREAEFEKVKRHVEGLDTTGLTAAYIEKFEKHTRLIPQYRIRRELNEKSAPGKYKDLYISDGEWDPLTNHSLSEKDSVEISKNRYLFKAIAENEIKKELLGQKFRELVPFPYRGDDVKTDTIFYPEYNFFYLYRHNYPVTPGLQRLYVTLKSRVEAPDLSTYNFPNSDTLIYVISSMDQLVDSTLAVTPEYKEALTLIKKKDYAPALKILEKTPDYNTALCLTLLGHREKAWALLRQLEETANVHYLSAIVLYQLERKNEAATHLLEACMLDTDKIFRIPQDSDMKMLVREFRLQSQLNELEQSNLY